MEAVIVPSWSEVAIKSCHAVGVFIVLLFWAAYLGGDAGGESLLAIAGGVWALTQVCAGLIRYWRGY